MESIERNKEKKKLRHFKSIEGQENLRKIIWESAERETLKQRISQSKKMPLEKMTGKRERKREARTRESESDENREVEISPYAF